MIWVDGIKKMQSVPSNNGQWKTKMMLFMTMTMALNFGMILSIIQLHFVGYVFYDIKIHIFPGEKLNNAISFFILYFILPLIINYLLIFRNNKYEKLLKEYKYFNGKLAIAYMFGSLVFAFIYGIFFTPTIK